MVGVVGSNPIAPTKENKDLGQQRVAFFMPEKPLGENSGENRNFLEQVTSGAGCRAVYPRTEKLTGGSNG
jgi:hypothetical protein